MTDFPKFAHIEGNPCMALELLETAFELTHIEAARRSIVDAAAEIIAEEIRQRPDKLESILDGL
jgi:hypothetical protein